MRRRPRRSTPAGEHRAVLLDEVLRVLDPQPGMTIVDCTVGWAGHSVELLKRIGPTGMLIGFDMDRDNLPRAQERLGAVGHPFHLHHANFAGLLHALAEHNVSQVHGLVADLGMSSMQVDDPDRGFSYSRDGVLDMRMDRSRGQTAAQLLARISAEELAQALHELGDEPHAEAIANAILAARGTLTTTRELSKLIQQATRQENWQLHPSRDKWTLHPAARTFQALRILVNRELGNLDNLLRILPLPGSLAPAGVAAIISFHSGEDRLVKASFRNGLHTGCYNEIANEPLRATFNERTANPRSRSAKLRWARRSPESK